MTEQSYNTQSLARRLNVSIDYFCRARKSLEQCGFPPPISLPAARPSPRKYRAAGRPMLRWDATAVETWIARQAPRAMHQDLGLNPSSANDNSTLTRAARAQETLERRLL